MRTRVLILVILLLLPITACEVLGGDTGRDGAPAATATNDAYPASTAESDVDPDSREGEVGQPVDEISITPQQPDPTAAEAVTPQPSPTAIASESSLPDLGDYPYGAQIGSPIAVLNFAHPEAGCQWQGLAGQVFDLEGEPVAGYVIEVGGTLNEEPFIGLALSGLAPAYGPGGYEIVIGNQPIASRATLWAALFGINGEQLSPYIYFDTFADCGQNLVILNFAQGSALISNEIYLPAVKNEAGQE